MRWQVPQSSELNLRTVGTVLPLVVVSVAYHSQSPLTALLPILVVSLSARCIGWWWTTRHSQRRSIQFTAKGSRGGASALVQGGRALALLRVATLPLSICSNKVTAVGFGCSTPTFASQGDELARCNLVAGARSAFGVGAAVRDDFEQLEASAGWIDPGLNFRRRRIQASQVDSSFAPLAVDWLSGCSLILCPTAHQPPARFDRGYPLLRIWISAAGWQQRCSFGVVTRRNWASARRRQPHLLADAYTFQPAVIAAISISTVPVGFGCAVTALILTALLRLPLQPRRSWAVLSGVRVAG